MSDNNLQMLIVFIASAGIGFMYSRIRSHRVTKNSLLIGGCGVILCIILLTILRVGHRADHGMPDLTDRATRGTDTDDHSK